MHFFPAFPVFTAHATRHINVAINLALLRHRAQDTWKGMAADADAGASQACSTRSNCSDADDVFTAVLGTRSER